MKLIIHTETKPLAEHMEVLGYNFHQELRLSANIKALIENIFREEVSE